MSRPFSCTRCGQEWPRDPALEVPCPTCNAAIGRACKRPSGHALMTDSRIHPARDRRALATVPGYAKCTGKPERRAS